MPGHESKAPKQGASLPEPTTNARFRVEHVFGDQRPFSQCHASTIVALGDGAALAAWFGGTREGHADVAIWAARRAAEAPDAASGSAGEGGAGSNLSEQWSGPIQIAKVSEEAHWNPVLFALSPDARDLVLHFKVGERIRRWATWSSRSRDGGRTWDEARPLVAHDRGARGAVRCKPIRLTSGDWLVGSSLERWRRWDAFFDRSANGLEDWKATPLVTIDRKRFSGKGLIQPTLWESSPGRVHALFRSTDGRIYRSDSEDDGHGWSRARAIDLPNNNSGLDLVRLPSGTLALACNPVEGNWAARTPLSILFSRDDGESWVRRIDIESAPGEFSYPAIIADGNDLLLSYTWNRRRIAFVRLQHEEIERLLAGAPAPEPR